METAEKIVKELINAANIEIPGDMEIHHSDFYARVLRGGPLGLGESYMEGWWDSKNLARLFEKINRANIGYKIKKSKRLLLKIAFSKIFNFQTQRRAWQVGIKHYDLGVSLFQKMLDSRMNYTCGYWNDANNLEEAQLAKLELTCRKLLLKPGMRLLDIGCGFGGLAKYAAENHGVEVVGVTISKEQQAYAQKITKGLPIQIRLQDYRDVKEKFDRIVSLGMFEHVGFMNYVTYMQTVHRCLKDDGIFLLHTIGNTFAEYPNEWITKYIFPNGMLPSTALIAKSSEKFFVMEDWHNFGADYDKTLMAWHQNFERHWPELKAHYDEKFYRMWNYYLLSCAGTFRARAMHLWQVVFTKEGLTGGYEAPRKVEIHRPTLAEIV
jgi:cyclopropane-fatty-acyl-phospholipid synthase